MNVSQEIRRRLQIGLNPSFIEVEDHSALHAGHVEAKASGGGHYALLIVADSFEGQNLIERHRCIYEQLDDLMKVSIHALAITAYTPKEWKASAH